MIDQLQTAADKVAAAMADHRDRGAGFNQLCLFIGVEPGALIKLADHEAQKFNREDGGAFIQGVLIGATAALERK